MFVVAQALRLHPKKIVARMASLSSSSNVIVDGTTLPLQSFITNGALYERCVDGPLDMKKWESYGKVIVQEILNKDAGESLSQSEAIRVYQYYLPVFFWAASLLQSHRQGAAGSSNAAPLVIGMSCPQGGGKTTLVDALNLLFTKDGDTCADMSLDDFYLTHAEQVSVAEDSKYAGNSLLELRGNPGTHDTTLALETLAALNTENNVKVPRYDKSAFAGRGDRRPEADWTTFSKRPDVVLFEGWCLGFSPLGSQDSFAADPRIAPIDALLAGPYKDLHEAMAAWIVVEVESPQSVYTWREQAEESMRNAGKPATTPEQVADFVDRYMPAYAHYLKGLYALGPEGSTGKPVLSFQIDHGRNPVSEANAKTFAA